MTTTLLEKALMENKKLKAENEELIKKNHIAGDDICNLIDVKDKLKRSRDRLAERLANMCGDNSGDFEQEAIASWVKWSEETR